MVLTYPLLSHPIKDDTEVSSATDGLEEVGSMATRAQKSSKALGLFNCFTDSIRKLVHEPLEMLCLQIPQTGQWAYPMLSTLHLCMASSPCAPMDKCKDLPTAHKHTQKAWPTLWDWKKAHKPEQLRALSREKGKANRRL